jgi:hypothetical protein
MAFVEFNKLSNKEFSHLPTKMELTNAQRRAWHAEMKTRLCKHSSCFAGTSYRIDLRDAEVQALTEGYIVTRKDVKHLLERAKSLITKERELGRETCERIILKVPSSTSPEHGEARDTFMAELGFKWVGRKSQHYERAL